MAGSSTFWWLMGDTTVARFETGAPVAGVLARTVDQSRFHPAARRGQPSRVLASSGWLAADSENLNPPFGISCVEGNDALYFSLEVRMWMNPRWLPLTMAAWNVLYVVVTLFGEGRLKVNALRFAVMYTGTAPAAMRGDLDPFLVVFMQPPL